MARSIIKSCNDEQFAVLCYSEEGFKRKDVNGTRVFSSSLLKRGRKVDLEELEKQLRIVYEEFEPDIVHGHNLSYSFNPEKTKLIHGFFKKKCPVIEHAHHAYINRKNFAERTISLDWDKIITVSRFAYKRISPLREDKKNICIIENCVDKELFDYRKRRDGIKEKEKLGIDNNKKVFLFPSRPVRISTGEIGEQKQLKTVLKALSLFKKGAFSDFLLLTANLSGYHKEGMKAIEDGFKKEVSRYGILENLIIFPRDLDHREMYKIYAMGDITLFPSLNESFGLVALESMAMGVPVVGASSGGVKEIINDGRTGLLIPPRDHKTLALCIERLTKEKGLYKRLMVGGLEEVQKYDIYQYGLKIKGVWDSSLES